MGGTTQELDMSRKEIEEITGVHQNRARKIWIALPVETERRRVNMCQRQ